MLTPTLASGLRLGPELGAGGFRECSCPEILIEHIMNSQMKTSARHPPSVNLVQVMTVFISATRIFRYASLLGF